MYCDCGGMIKWLMTAVVSNLVLSAGSISAATRTMFRMGVSDRPGVELMCE